MPTLAEKLTEAEKQWQQAIAQAAYWQGKVEVLRDVIGQAQPELPGVTPNGDMPHDPAV